MKLTTINTATATNAELVAYYNANTEGKKVTKFKDHGTAVRRVTELQEALREMAERSRGTGKGKQNAGKDKAATVKAILEHMLKDDPEMDVAKTRLALTKMGMPELKGELASWVTPVEPVQPVPAAAGALPPPAPLPPAPAPSGAPKEIELVKDGIKGKRYVSKTEPDSKYHLRDRSERQKPVDYVRCFCNDNANLSRKEVIAALVEQGVNKNTAATQYSLWKSKRVATVQPGELMGSEGEEGFEE